MYFTNKLGVTWQLTTSPLISNGDSPIPSNKGKHTWAFKGLYLLISATQLIPVLAIGSNNSSLWYWWAIDCN